MGTPMCPNESPRHVRSHMLNTWLNALTFKIYPKKLVACWIYCECVRWLHFGHLFRHILNILYIFRYGHMVIRALNTFPMYSPWDQLGTLRSNLDELSKCTHNDTHWVHWGHMGEIIENVLKICPLGTLGSHNGAHLKCTQILITGHIGITCCLYSQCVHNVPSGYFGPCPQWEGVLLNQRLRDAWDLPVL